MRDGQTGEANERWQFANRRANGTKDTAKKEWILERLLSEKRNTKSRCRVAVCDGGVDEEKKKRSGGRRAS